MDVVHKTHGQQRSLWTARFFAVALCGAASGCGGAIYAVTATSASSKLESARALGAERYAPFEYWMAHEHLEKAAEEAAAADYGDALDFVDVADEFADKAAKLSRQAHEGAGR